MKKIALMLTMLALLAVTVTAQEPPPGEDGPPTPPPDMPEVPTPPPGTGEAGGPQPLEPSRGDLLGDQDPRHRSHCPGQAKSFCRRVMPSTRSSSARANDRRM